MDEIIIYLSNCNWQTVLAMFIIGWYFSRDIRQEIKDFRKDINKQENRIDILYQMFVDLLKEKRGKK
jgi:cell division protein FtsL